MGIKNVFKWRVTSTKYLYLTDEENKNPFILDKKTGDRFYPVPANSSPVTGSTKVTGVTLDEGLISQTVAQIKSETVYAEKYNRMVELAAYDEAASGLTFLDYTNYFNLDGDECVEEAVTPKCEGYEPVFNVSAYTLEDGSEVEYTFYADKNESDKTLRYNLTLGIPRGEKGEKGEDGVGCKGEPGEPGLPAIIDNVSATIRALDPDEQPDVKVVSSSTQDNKYDLQFNFKIPRGEQGVPGDEGQQGEDGIPARLAYVGIESETLLPSENAYVQIKEGSYEIEKVYDSQEGQEFYDTSFILQFGLPQGLQGIQGEPGRNAEIRNVTVSRVETIEPGYWYPNEDDPNREWILNNAQAGVEITPIGGGNIVDLAFWFIIPRGEKGEKGADGSGGGGGWTYNFTDPQFTPTPGLEEPIGDFDVRYYPLLGTADVTLQIYYPENWGGGGKKCRGYVWTEYTSEGGIMRFINSFAEGDIETAEGTNNQPIATGYRSHAEGKRTKAIGEASHAEGIGITPEPSALENIIGGLKNNCHGNNIIVMPKQQFVDGNVDWNDLDEDFFIGATFSIPSGIPINVNALPSGVTETQFRNSILTITSCSLDYYNAENNYFSLEDVSVSFVVAGQTYQIDSSTFESCSYGILQTVGGDPGVGINEYVDWNNPITIHINNVTPISIPNAIGVASHTEGNGCQTNGDYSHAEGNGTRTVGVASHAEGAYTEATGDYSHASGYGTISESTASYAGGYATGGGRIQTNNSGDGAHAEGYVSGNSNITASGTGSLAFGSIWGDNSKILSDSETSVAIGNIDGDNSFIEATSDGACAIGSIEGDGGTIQASGIGSHAEGYAYSGATIQASNYGAYARGYAYGSGGTIEATGNGAHTEGYVSGNSNLTASGTGSLAFGSIFGDNSKILSDSETSVAIGNINGNDASIEASGNGACAIGCIYNDGGTIVATYNGAHAEGFAEDGGTIEASASGSHAEGYAYSGGTIQASGSGAHAEGCNTIASGIGAHAEGIGYPGESHDINCTLSSNSICDTNKNYSYTNIIINEKFEKEEIYIIGSIFEYHDAIYTVTSAGSSYNPENTHTAFTNVMVEDKNGNETNISNLLGGVGKKTESSIILSGVTMDAQENAIGVASHTENNLTVAEGDYSHAEGNETRANGVGSHAEGCFSEANGDYSHAAGLGTIANQDYMTAIGKFNNSGTTSGDLFVIGNGTDNENRSNVLSVNGSTKKITLSQDGGIKLPSGGTSTLVWNTSGGTTDLNSFIPTVSVPAGTIQMYAGSSAPTGWLLCNGSAVSRTGYSNLFAVCGITYGDGDGTTTFNLPNLQQRFPLGVSTNYTLGVTGGTETVTLSENEMPEHSHGITQLDPSTEVSQTGTLTTVSAEEGAALFIEVSGNGTQYRTTETMKKGTASGSSYNNVLSSSGAGQAHNNMPPYLAINFIIKY